MTLDIMLSGQNGSLFLSFKGGRDAMRDVEESSEVQGTKPMYFLTVAGTHYPKVQCRPCMAGPRNRL